MFDRDGSGTIDAAELRFPDTPTRFVQTSEKCGRRLTVVCLCGREVCGEIGIVPTDSELQLMIQVPTSLLL